MAALTLALATLYFAITFADAWHQCNVSARTESGWVCGTRRLDSDGGTYASFRGVPYASQPVGNLRFKELQPAKPWNGYLNATIEGPVCPFHDIFYGSLLQPQGVSEACIHANIHVPFNGLPKPGSSLGSSRRLPVLVYIHGGGWIDGSGDADVNGPEYLVSKDVIVITFNYRLDVFGFLCLNTAKAPGNNGLRDIVTFLQWVQRNVHYFGGDPDDVTLAGQSAGSSSAHLLSLSPVTKGLFKRIWLMSGTAIQSYYTASPKFTQLVTSSFLSLLDLGSVSHEEAYDRLVEMPFDVIMNASTKLLAQFGVTTFVPVVESKYPNVTAIIEDDPEVLLEKGYGKDIPLVIGFTNVECETSRYRLADIDIVNRYNENPSIGLSPHLLFTKPSDEIRNMSQKVSLRYFNGKPATLDEFIKLCTETYFQYPALKLARLRAASRGAPVWLYKFAYNADYSALKISKNMTYVGAGHSEDMTTLFKTNSLDVPHSNNDKKMIKTLTDLLVSFVKNNEPARWHWPAIGNDLEYQFLESYKLQYVRISEYDQEMVHFFDTL
ncbi:hypothetical protein ACJJTC_005279 [Scirpophaga incertulas]